MFILCVENKFLLNNLFSKVLANLRLTDTGIKYNGILCIEFTKLNGNIFDISWDNIWWHYHPGINWWRDRNVLYRILELMQSWDQKANGHVIKNARSLFKYCYRDFYVWQIYALNCNKCLQDIKDTNADSKTKLKCTIYNYNAWIKTSWTQNKTG